MRVCRRAFLSLWSYPNLFKDKGKKGNSGHGKELCDLLVVFGDDVLIFLTNIATSAWTKEVAISWRRWYTAAILDSAGQIAGAERWLAAVSFQSLHRSQLHQAAADQLSQPAQVSSHPHLPGRSRGEPHRLGWLGSLFVSMPR